MKTTFFALLLVILTSCSKQDDPIPPDPLAKLPPITQVGANTFGCVINGQVFYPRDGTSTLFNPGGRGFISWGSPGNDRIWNELEIRNSKDGKPCSRMIIHLQNLPQTQIGEYIWHPSNFKNSIDGLMQNYVFGQIYDTASNTWKYYGSYESSGKVTITRYNNIVSGNFSGKLRLINSTEEIDIQNGRFDFNGATLPDTLFP
jgi:hypothetical protein